MAAVLYLGWVFERLAWLSFAVPVFYMSLTNPGYFHHLTYWTLTLHAVYFAVDKTSPYGNAVKKLLHGASFCGAFSVFIGYTFISICGGAHHGSWLKWENAVGAHAGTVVGNRSLLACAAQKMYEHLWPVIAVVMDARLGREALTRAYAGMRPSLMLMMGMGSFFLLGSIWEATSAAKKGNVLTVYQQPPYLTSSKLLDMVGVSAPGLAEDFIFVTTQKLLLIAGSIVAYMRIVAPLVGATAASGNRKTK